MDRKPSNPKDTIAHTKVPMELLPPTALYYMAAALGYGARKYGPWNWRETGIRVDVYIGAMLRHLMEYAAGNEYDHESGLPHLAHILANAAILVDATSTGNLVDIPARRDKLGAEALKRLREEIEGLQRV